MSLKNIYKDETIRVVERITQIDELLTYPDVSTINGYSSFVTSLTASESFSVPHDRYLENLEQSFLSACCYLILAQSEKEERFFSWLAKMLYWGTVFEDKETGDTRLDWLFDSFIKDYPNHIAASFYSYCKLHMDVYPSYFIARDCLLRLDHHLRGIAYK